MQEDERLSEIRRIDHLGLVSGVARKIQLVEIIDAMIPPAPQRGATVGESVLALVLNGLGFSRPLYLTPAFFETKPVGTLIPPGTDRGGSERVHTGTRLGRSLRGRSFQAVPEPGLYGGQSLHRAQHNSSEVLYETDISLTFDIGLHDIWGSCWRLFLFQTDKRSYIPSGFNK